MPDPQGKSETTKTRECPLKSRWLWGIVSVLVLFLFFYPNPLLYAHTLAHVAHPPIEPAAIAHYSATLPDDPARIEQWVRERIAYDADGYQDWGVAFYIARPDQTLRRGGGHCWDRAMVLASILEEKQIPYRLFANWMHAWVDYAGRQPYQEYEYPKYAAFRWEQGRWHFQGMGWLTVVPRQSIWLTRLLWHILSWPQKIALLTAMLSAIGLQWRFRRRSKAGAH